MSYHKLGFLRTYWKYSRAYLKRLLLRKSSKNTMCDYTRIEPEKNDVLQAGLNFLEKSRDSNGSVRRSQSHEVVNPQAACTVSVGDAVHDMLKKAVKENEVFMRQIRHEEDFCLRWHRSRKRRGAVCEEDVLERDGLLELLQRYTQLMHLQAYSLI